jgi:hypothetical protein
MGLKLRELPANEEIFIDANIFLYSAFKHPVFGNKCKNFLIRIEKEEIYGCFSCCDNEETWNNKHRHK